MFQNIFSKTTIKGNFTGGDFCGNVSINGKVYRGNNVSIIDNKVFIDGKEQTPDKDTKEIKIEVVGNIQELQIDYANSISIKGDVGSVNTNSGDVKISGNVTGSVITNSGDINCGKVAGNINTNSGDIECR